MSDAASNSEDFPREIKVLAEKVIEKYELDDIKTGGITMEIHRLLRIGQLFMDLRFPVSGYAYFMLATFLSSSFCNRKQVIEMQKNYVPENAEEIGITDVVVGEIADTLLTAIGVIAVSGQGTPVFESMKADLKIDDWRVLTCALVFVFYRLFGMGKNEEFIKRKGFNGLFYETYLFCLNSNFSIDVTPMSKPEFEKMKNFMTDKSLLTKSAMDLLDIIGQGLNGETAYRIFHESLKADVVNGTNYLDDTQIYPKVFMTFVVMIMGDAFSEDLLLKYKAFLDNNPFAEFFAKYCYSLMPTSGLKNMPKDIWSIFDE